MRHMAEMKKKMNSITFSFLLCIVVPGRISRGRCDPLSFSICWTTRGDVFNSSEADIWLNGTGLKAIGTQGKFVSLTVPQTVENQLSLRYGGVAKNWTVSIQPGSATMEIRSVDRPEKIPFLRTRELLDLLSGEVFGCENSTVILHQDQELVLVLGYTSRLPVRLEAWSSSMLLLSWAGLGGGPWAPGPTPPLPRVSLYSPQLGSYILESREPVQQHRRHHHHRFTTLKPCHLYTACLEPPAGTRTCIGTITGPREPRFFRVTSWNSSSISVAWVCPENHRRALFLLTAFHLDAGGGVLEEVRLWQHGRRFTLADLEPCSRVQLGLQTVCQAGTTTRYSRMEQVDGNTAHSSIGGLQQESWGPENYTLSWEVRNTSSVSGFRVFHQGALQGATLFTRYTVGGLQPCGRYHAQVVALCGDGVVMDNKTIDTYTGPRGVQDLRYRANESLVLWTPGTPVSPPRHLAFAYRLALANGSEVRRGRVSRPGLPLPGLLPGQAYSLEVLEECQGAWSSSPAAWSSSPAAAWSSSPAAAWSSSPAAAWSSSPAAAWSSSPAAAWSSSPAVVLFQGASVPMRPRGLALGLPEIQLDFSGPTQVLIVPWPLAPPLRKSEPRAKMEELIQTTLEVLLSGPSRPARVALEEVDSSPDGRTSRILFRSADEPVADGNLSIPLGHSLDYIQSLRVPNLTAAQGLLYWEGRDLCLAADPSPCPAHSLCVNTLLSYACVCRHGYYDVGGAMPGSHDALHRPVCQEQGMVSHCAEGRLSGAVSRDFLRSRLGGDVSLLLNDGRCSVEEHAGLYSFSTPPRASPCNTSRLVNETHVELRNVLRVTLTEEQTIARHDLTLVWACVFPRHALRSTGLSAGLDWFSGESLVEVNTSLVLRVAMALYSDASYTFSYRYAVELDPEDSLFFHVELQSNDSFAPDVHLQLASCWATESSDPKDPVQALLLQDGCAVDPTLQWAGPNGGGSSSRFSLQMFQMPTQQYLYFHCLTHVCGPDHSCTPRCPVLEAGLRSEEPSSMVSAGPLLVRGDTTPPGPPAFWTDGKVIVWMVGGFIGCLGLALLALCTFSPERC
ncbi:uncharacterized protein LOC130381489 isoform X2 [Gadus chalcogrammus]|uniref:uncharacterized protein LOC130381489 isoform X2 n=1 Tax=Gadus chalcogrammus TaxID=1042646 RepID=UPI0024C356CF|nr:uncharacterized protein LOC130381489 isoform X2 [Gadus chalcogrammus]